MLLTDNHKVSVQAAFKLMGLNGGLFYKALLGDLAKNLFDEKAVYPNEAARKHLVRVGEEYGLHKQPLGIVVYEAYKRGDAGKLEITLPPPITVKLSALE